MVERFEEFGAGVDAVLITFSDPKYARSYRSRTGWHHPIVHDQARAVYQQFGYGRGTVWRVYGWRVIRRYYDLLRSGNVGRYERATEDTLQLGGNAVVDSAGTVSWVYRGTGPDDRPTVDQLLIEVKRAQEQTG